MNTFIGRVRKSIRTLYIITRGIFAQSARNAEDIFVKFAATSIVGTISFYFINHHTGMNDVDKYRIVNIVADCALLGLSFIRKNTGNAKYLAWYAMLLSNLVLMVFLSHLNSFDFSSITYLLSFVTLLIICIDKLVVTFTLCLSSYLIAWSLGMTQISTQTVYTASYWDVFSCSLIFAQYIILTKKDSKKKVFNTISSMNNLLNIFASEARTPLRTIASYSLAIQNYFPKLVDAYKQASMSDIGIPKICPVHLEILSDAVGVVERETHNLFLMLDMLLMKLTYDPEEPFKVCSAVKCIETALENYNITEKYKLRIKFIKAYDFSFYGSEILLIHIIYNLLNNAFYQIQAANQGNIEISLGSDKKNNIIFFKDTASGIADDVLPYIFNEFFSTYSGKIGLGLSFCKSTMKKFNGSICCETRMGEYSLFKLAFPKLSKRNN